ncbi:MAG: hypothetical protein IID45_06175 [Planctomycetes bacterium]|nr:hypothetical protein [Planctomycetota bacterium]
MLRSMLWILPLAWIVGCQSAGDQSLTTSRPMDNTGDTSAAFRSFRQDSNGENRGDNPGTVQTTAAAIADGTLPGSSIGFLSPPANPTPIRQSVRRRGG